MVKQKTRECVFKHKSIGRTDGWDNVRPSRSESVAASQL